MANILSSLLVELGINTAAFGDGMSKATYQAKQSAQQIGSALSSIGSMVESVGGKFGEFGNIVGQSLGKVGQTMSSLIRGMGSFSGATGALKLGAVGFGAIATGAVTAGAAVIGIAVHASESAAHLYELSQATGVGVKELSGLGVIGKLVGLDMDVLAKGLERMDRSMLMAAKAPNLPTNAYRQLGISVQDSAGHLKKATDIFAEVADKFSVMEDGATKTALAMQMFGRAGAELIPVLNKGGDAIKYWVDYGTRVGAVLDEKAAKGAEAFRNELTKLDLIQTGVQNKLMTALLPALDHITAAFSKLAENGTLMQQFGVITSRAMLFIAESTLSVVSAVLRLRAGYVELRAAMDAFESKHSTFFGGSREFPGMTDDQRKNMVNETKMQLYKAEQEISDVRTSLESNAVTPPGPQEKARTGAAPSTAAGGKVLEVPYEQYTKLERELMELDKLQQEFWAHAREGADKSGMDRAIADAEFFSKQQEEMMRTGKQGLSEKKKQYDDFSKLLGGTITPELANLSALMAIAEASGDKAAQAIISGKITEELHKMAEQADETAMKFGNLKDALKGFADSLIQTSATMRGSFFTTFKQGVDGAQQSLAQFIVTGRGSFINVLKQMEEGVIKLGIQFLLMAAKKEAAKMMGLGADASAAATSVALAETERQAMIGAAAASAAAAAGPAAIPVAITTEAALQGITAMAAGGDMVPGHAYLVGEKHPEIMVAGAAGHVYPTAGDMPKAAGSSKMGGNTTINVNHSVSTMDGDSFRSVMKEHSDILADVITSHLRNLNMAVA